jgi:hypothetical protein
MIIAVKKEVSIMKYIVAMILVANTLSASESKKKPIGIYQCCNNLSENIQLKISEQNQSEKKIMVNAKQKQMFFFTPGFKLSVLKSDKTVIASLTIDDYADNVITIEQQGDQPLVYVQQKIDEKHPLLMSCAQYISEPNTPREPAKKNNSECCHCPQQ